MDVLFCFDRRYEQHFGVAVTSLLLNNSGAIARVHIITDRASKTLKIKLDALKKAYFVEFLIYEVEAENLKELRLSAHISTAAYFRLLAADLLPQDLDKVLYLDSDLIVNQSIEELIHLEIDDYFLAAWSHQVVTTKKRLDLNSDRYFNSGVMLMNLAAWRRDQIAQKTIQFAQENPALLRFHDQDALNKIVDGRFLHLPEKWNSLVDLYEARSKVTSDSVIIHFVGSLKPWQVWALNADKEIYWKYLRQSPWSNALPTFPTSLKQFLSAGHYLLSCVRKGKLKPKFAN